MQYYDITISANGMQEQGVSGRYFYYLSGTTPLISGGVTPSAAGNEKIFVQAMGTGEAVPLMPGQSFRIDDSDKRPTGWRITNANRNETITGQVLIGDGEFRDSNIKNTVKLDLTSANQVTVQNASLTTTVTNEVEVKNDAGNPLNVAVAGTPAVTISGTATVQENLIAVNGGVTHANINSGFATTVFTAAANVNGAIIQSAQGSFTNHAAVSGVVMIAKAAGDPANITDGMMIAGGILGANKDGVFELRQKIRIPAGYGVKIFNGAANLAAIQVGATFTLL